MTWDQIEIEWRAMTRRVRSDLPRNAQAAPQYWPIDGARLTVPDDVSAPPAKAKPAHVG